MVDGQVVKKDGCLVHARIDELRSQADELVRRVLNGA
jgi:hypothetical protein